MLTTLAIAGCTLYAAAAVTLYIAQRHILFVPENTRPNIADAGTPGLQDLTLTTPDNLRLLAWYLPPKPGQPVIAYFHGNGGNLADRIPRIRAFAAHGRGDPKQLWTAPDGGHEDLMQRGALDVIARFVAHF